MQPLTLGNPRECVGDGLSGFRLRIIWGLFSQAPTIGLGRMQDVTCVGIMSAGLALKRFGLLCLYA